MQQIPGVIHRLMQSVPWVTQGWSYAIRDLHNSLF